MKVFLSSSGTTSREIATALHDWIPRVIQGAKPFMSTSDIDKGQVWVDAIGKELNESDFGIICLTKYNNTSPWLHFEAGAISRALGKASVSPLLFDVDRASIEGPFQQFQLTTYSFECEESVRKDEIRGLMRSLNNCLKADERLSEELLKAEFDEWWTNLKDTLDLIRPKQDKVTHTAYPWLYAIEDLMHAQRDDRVKSVWWVAPDPYRYVLNSPQKETITEGMRRGAVYTFLVSADQGAAAGKLIELTGGKPDAISIVHIPNDEFGAAAVTDYVIIDPDANRRVFLDLPLSHRGFWIEVFARGADGFYERFGALKRKYEDASGSTAGAVASPH